MASSFLAFPSFLRLAARTDKKESVESIIKDVQNCTPDLEKLLKQTTPTYKGKKLTKRQSKMILETLNAVLNNSDEVTKSLISSSKKEKSY